MEVLTDSVDATRGAEHLQWAKKLYQVALEKKDEYHKEEALREIMAYYVRTILNCINQITEEGRIVVSYCLNPEKNVASVLIAGTGNISVAGAVSAGTNDDMTWLVCKMIAECMNAHLWKDEEFKDGLRFIFKLPQ